MYEYAREALLIQAARTRQASADVVTVICDLTVGYLLLLTIRRPGFYCRCAEMKASLRRYTCMYRYVLE